MKTCTFTIQGNASVTANVQWGLGNPVRVGLHHHRGCGAVARLRGATGGRGATRGRAVTHTGALLPGAPAHLMVHALEGERP